MKINNSIYKIYKFLIIFLVVISFELRSAEPTQSPASANKHSLRSILLASQAISKMKRKVLADRELRKKFIESASKGLSIIIDGEKYTVLTNVLAITASTYEQKLFVGDPSPTVRDTPLEQTRQRLVIVVDLFTSFD